MQSIASTGFGIETSAFDDAKSAELRKHAKKITGADSTGLDVVKGLLGFLAPGLTKTFRIEMSNKESLLFFVDIVRETVASRRRVTRKRNDLVDFFMPHSWHDGALTATFASVYIIASTRRCCLASCSSFAYTIRWV